MRIRTALGHLSRVLHGSCDASRSKEGHRVVGVAVFNRARVRCANAFGEFGISQLFRANTYYRMPWNLVRVSTYQDYLYFPTNSRFFTTSTCGTVLTILRLVVVGRAQLRHSERHTRRRPSMFSLGLGRFLRGEARKNAKEKKETYEVSPRPFRRAACPAPSRRPLLNAPLLI